MKDRGFPGGGRTPESSSGERKIRRVLDRAVIASLITDVLRAWDPRSAAGLATYGERTLLRHEAARIWHTVGLLDIARPPQRLLEVGSGYLTVAITLRRIFPEARLVSIEHPGRRYLWTGEYRRALGRHRISLVAADLERPLPFSADAFDVVVFAEVIEHLPPNIVPYVLTELARVLRPGGSLVVTTPNLAAWTNREMLLRGRSPQEPSADIDGTYPHLRLYTMSELEGLLRAAGLVVVRRVFIDRVWAGASRARRLLAALMVPARHVWPALRDTCGLRGVRPPASEGSVTARTADRDET